MAIGVFTIVKLRDQASRVERSQLGHYVRECTHVDRDVLLDGPRDPDLLPVAIALVQRWRTGDFVLAR